MKNKIVCIGNGPVMSFTPYMAKLALTLEGMNLRAKFLTWQRLSDKTTATDPSCIDVEVLMFKGRSDTSSASLVMLYLLWMFKLFFFILKSDDTHYICSRFENCFPIWLASKFRKLNYIYADRDALHSTYNWPKVIKWFIKWLESKISLAAKVHLIPGQSRDFTNGTNVKVVPNLPSTWILETAKDIYKSRGRITEDGILTVYINGWLAPTRGRVHILNALSSAKLKNSVKFIIAGEMQEEHIKSFEKQINVRYLGRLSSEEALSYYYDADVVVSLYDPSIEINTKAEPNKWWDCAVTRTPFITNFGIDTLEQFTDLVEYELIDYTDVHSLETCLLYYAGKNREKNSIITKDDMSVELWDNQVLDIINDFYK